MHQASLRHTERCIFNFLIDNKEKLNCIKTDVYISDMRDKVIVKIYFKNTDKRSRAIYDENKNYRIFNLNTADDYNKLIKELEFIMTHDGMDTKTYNKLIKEKQKSIRSL
jgi:hypothetical protein